MSAGMDCATAQTRSVPLAQSSGVKTAGSRVLLGEVEDLVGVGSDEDLVEQGAGAGGAIDPGDHGLAGNFAEDLAGQARGAEAGGDDGEDVAKVRGQEGIPPRDSVAGPRCPVRAVAPFTAGTVVWSDGESMGSQTAINPNLETILREHRVFPPPEEFAKQAHIKSLAEYQRMYQRSVQDPEGFWAEAASELHWFKPWDKVLDWNLPWAKWFVGRQDQPLLQLRGPACGERARGQDGDPVGGRAGRGSEADLCRTARARCRSSPMC